MTHLFYEPEAQAVYESHREWDADFSPCDLPIKAPAVPAYGASEREHRAYQRARVKYAQDPCHQLRRDERDQGYIKYQSLFSAQEQLRKQDFGAPVILDAFSRLPKLVSISTSLGRNPMPGSPYLHGRFQPGLLHQYGDLVQCHPAGVPQLRSLLLGSHHAGRQLTKLIIGNVNWQFLRDEAGNIDRMKQSLRHLRVLDLMISTDYYINADVVRFQISEGREYPGDNALCDFIKAAPELESLSIAFDYYTTGYATRLKQIVCDHHWPNLMRVEFDKIDATQTDFADFFTRHASTLRHLGLRDIRLVEQCQWVPTLEMVQETLSLDTATLGHGIHCEDPPQYWTLEANDFEDDDEEDAQGNITSKALSNYLVHGGSCPLLDEGKHPNQCLGLFR